MPGSFSPLDLIAYEVQVNRRDIEGERLLVASLPPPPKTCTFFRVFHTQVSASAQTEKPQTGPQGYSGGACRGAGCRVSGLGILGLVPACCHLSWVTPKRGLQHPQGPDTTVPCPQTCASAVGAPRCTRSTRYSRGACAPPAR